MTDRPEVARARWAKRHAGHEVHTSPRSGRRWCRTCAHVLDEVAVQRAVAGDPPKRLTPAERWTAVRILRNAGLSCRKIAALVRCSDRTVWRVLQRDRQAGR